MKIKISTLQKCASYCLYQLHCSTLSDFSVRSEKKKKNEITSNGHTFFNLKGSSAKKKWKYWFKGLQMPMFKE